MVEKEYQDMKNLLASNAPEDIQRGLDQVRKILPELSGQELQEVVDMVSSLFYIDLLDRPDLVPVIDEAISLVGNSGERVIPILVDNLAAGDLKAQLAIGHAMGRVGEDAIEPLLDAYRDVDNVEQHIFVLYALGKIDSPQVRKGLDIALEAAQAGDPELRDTATRVLGKFVSSIPPQELTPDEKQAILESIQEGLSDERAGIRSKAVRSYGKLARHGHLDQEETEELKEVCRLILGSDQFNWDRAFIVRKEARQILDGLSS